SPSKAKVKPKLDNKERKRLKKELTLARSKENAPHKKELEFCEAKIMELEVELENENQKLIEASNTGDNSIIIEASQSVGKLQKEVDELFERLEIASHAFDEIEKKYLALLDKLE
ncbi:MAG: COG0488: ATPase components of ABC transporters with duplicated ATPase domains, partial [uncultured Sulfurovum sp.]